MSFEAEVIPLFIGGVLVVSSFELIVGCVLLKNKKSACKKFVLQDRKSTRLNSSHRT